MLSFVPGNVYNVTIPPPPHKHTVQKIKSHNKQQTSSVSCKYNSPQVSNVYIYKISL